MQKITISGRLGRDAVVRELPNGGNVISFVVAANGRHGGVEKTSWYDVSIFNYERYKNMAKYLTKGSSVLVGGDLEADLETGKDGVVRCRRSITADFLEFNSNGSNSENAKTDASKSTAPKAEVPKEEDAPMTRKRKEVEVSASTEDTDELPF